MIFFFVEFVRLRLPRYSNLIVLLYLYIMASSKVSSNVLPVEANRKLAGSSTLSSSVVRVDSNRKLAGSSKVSSSALPVEANRKLAGLNEPESPCTPSTTATFIPKEELGGLVDVETPKAEPTPSDSTDLPARRIVVGKWSSVEGKDSEEQVQLENEYL